MDCGLVIVRRTAGQAAPAALPSDGLNPTDESRLCRDQTFSALFTPLRRCANGLADSNRRRYPRCMAAALVEHGPWKGWKAWHDHPKGRFVDGLGDVFTRDGAFPDGAGVLSAIDTGMRHANGLGYLHGGFLMAFVDVAMFATIRHLLATQAAVTLQCSTDFLGAGNIGEVLEGRGRVTHETGKLIWVSGTLTQADGTHLVAQWHGLLRKVPRTPR